MTGGSVHAESLTTSCLKLRHSDHGGFDFSSPAFERPIALTQTPEFRRWFANSPVVGPQGDPMRLYHGTKQGANIYQFEPKGASNSVLTGDAYGVGVYLTSDPREAALYAKENGVVYPLYAAGRILDFDAPLDKKVSEELTALAEQSLGPKDLFKFDLPRCKQTFTDSKEALECFHNQMENWKYFDSIATRTKPRAKVVDGIFEVQFTDFNQKVLIDTGPKAFSLFSVIGFENLPAAGFDGCMMNREDERKWVILYNPDYNLKSAIGNNGQFDPLDPRIDR